MGESKAATAEDARDWQMMLDVYECRVNDLSILTSIGQGLITAITLSAALGAPLLIIGTEKSVANAFFGAGLLVYLALLAASLRQAFMVLYSRMDEAPRIAKAGEGLMNWRWVSEQSLASYQAYLTRTDHEARVQSPISQDWIAASLVADKAKRVRSTVQYAGASLGMLALLTITRFAIIFAG